MGMQNVSDFLFQSEILLQPPFRACFQILFACADIYIYNNIYICICIKNTPKTEYNGDQAIICSIISVLMILAIGIVSWEAWEYSVLNRFNDNNIQFQQMTDLSDIVYFNNNHTSFIDGKISRGHSDISQPYYFFLFAPSIIIAVLFLVHCCIKVPVCEKLCLKTKDCMKALQSMSNQKYPSNDGSTHSQPLQKDLTVNDNNVTENPQIKFEENIHEIPNKPLMNRNQSHNESLKSDQSYKTDPDFAGLAITDYRQNTMRTETNISAMASSPSSKISKKLTDEWETELKTEYNTTKRISNPVIEDYFLR